MLVTLYFVERVCLDSETMHEVIHTVAQLIGEATT